MYFIFDTETTGLKPGYHEILHLAGILVDSGLNEIGRGEFKVHPNFPERAECDALNINGIDLKTWKATCETHREAIDRLHNWILTRNNKPGEIMLAGYNVFFDIGFYDAMLESVGKKDIFSYRKIDIMSLAIDYIDMFNLSARNYKLTSICDSIGISTGGAHNAMTDADMALMLWRYMRNNILSLKEQKTRLF